jgi:uncharacterized protein YdaU (DUF1376 family)
MKRPSFPFYVNNFLASERVMCMSAEQIGAYVLLLCYQWNSDYQSVPSDPEWLRVATKCNGRWEQVGDAVLACYHPVPDQPGRMRNERLYHCWNERQKHSEHMAEIGKMGGRSRR